MGQTVQFIASISSNSFFHPVITIEIVESEGCLYAQRSNRQFSVLLSLGYFPRPQLLTEFNKAPGLPWLFISAKFYREKKKNPSKFSNCLSWGRRKRDASSNDKQFTQSPSFLFLASEHQVLSFFCHNPNQIYHPLLLNYITRAREITVFQSNILS